jgi:small-conductance mechanosensitive channel
MNQSNQIMNVFGNLNEAALFSVILIIASAIALIIFAQKILSWLAAKMSGRYRLYTLASVPVLRFLIIILSVIMIIPRIIEPTFENLVAVLGALGLALGFAFKDYVSSLIAGVVTLYEIPYRVGDWIEIDGAYGEVKSINMRTVEIVTPGDTVVVIPHIKLWDRLIFNANDGTRNLQCTADFFLHPRHDGSRVRNALMDVALTSPFLKLENPVKVIAKEEPWGTRYRIRAYPVYPEDQFEFISDLTIRGKDSLSKLEVEFPSIPSKYWEKSM